MPSESSSRRQKVEALFHEVVDMLPEERAAYLQSVCNDPVVRDEVLAMISFVDEDDSSIATQVGQVMGTPAYMSPEQAGMDAHEIDSRTDIYSLGIILYEVLVGATPISFDEVSGGHPLEKLQKIVKTDPPKPSTRLSRLVDEGTDIGDRRGVTLTSLRRKLRGDIDWIVMKALEKERGRRYQSASELRADIERHLHHEPVIAGPPSAIYRLRKMARRHRVGLEVVVLLLAVVLGYWGVDSFLDRLDQENQAHDYENVGRSESDRHRDLSSRLEIISNS